MFRLGCIEFLPPLEKLYVAVSNVKVTGEERLDIFKGSWLDELLPRLESANEVRDASLGRVKEFGWGNRCLFAITAHSYFRNDSIVYHVVVPHEDFSFLAELVSLEYSPLIFFLVFLFED